MDSTRQIHVIPPRAYLNDPTVLTPMPAKSLELKPALFAANDPTRTASLLGSDTSTPMPRVGDIVLGFKLVDKLGEGGFGSVFLGEQLGLAARPVALKFTSRANQEPERLASLQHTNIVPVYSVHTMPPIQVPPG